jgi:transposase InsO family protein
MKAVTDALGVARSNVAERVKGTRRLRGPQTRDGDLELAAEIRRLVDTRPTYGYRRIAALLKRERRSADPHLTARGAFAGRLRMAVDIQTCSEDPASQAEQDPA